VNDCRDLQYSFFYDPFRSPRLVDRLEEDLVHHASVLSGCNSRNVAFMPDTHNGPVVISKFSLDKPIRGTFSFCSVFRSFFIDVQLYKGK